MGAIEVGEDGLEFVDLRARADEDLLAAVYHELMLPTILLPEERQPLALWTRRLGPDPPPAPVPFVTGVAAGSALDDPGRRRLAGYLMLEYYRGSRTALVSYVGVDSGFRRRGIARRMLRFARARLAGARSPQDGAAVVTGPVRATWAEIHVPGQIEVASEPMVTLDRVRSFAALGASVVPIDYIQPALEVGQEFGRSLMLLVLAGDDRDPPPAHVGRSTVRDFLVEYYRSCGFAEPAEVEEFRSTEASLAAAAAGRPHFRLPRACEAAIPVATVEEDGPA